MKKIVLILAFVLALMLPSAALAQTDTVNLYIQLLDQKSAADSVTCVTLKTDATGEISQQILDSSLQAAYKNFPVQQFSVQVSSNNKQNTPVLTVSLYRGSKTQILHMDQNTAEISVASTAKQLSLGLVLDGSILKPYAVSEKTTKAFASLPEAKNQVSSSQAGVKFYFQDTWGTTNNGVSLKIDAGDAHPANLDGQIYLDSVSMGTHKLIASSKNGVKLAESYFTLDRKGDTNLSGNNQTNPLVSMDAGQQVVYALADVQDNLIKIRQVSAVPLSPGTRPELSTVTLQGCLLDSDKKPVPQIKLTLGGFSSTTDASGAFAVSKLPVDQYQVVAKDASGKKLAAFNLLMEKEFSTGIKEVALNSASITIGPSASTVYLTLQLTDDHALILKDASDKELSVPVQASASAAAQQAPATPAAPGSLLAVYLYLLVAILALIVVVIVVLVRLRRTGRTKH